MGWCRGLADGIDELSDATELGVVALVGEAVAQQLAHHEQRTCAFTGPQRTWEDDVVAGVRDGVAVQPSSCTEGDRDKSCCS